MSRTKAWFKQRKYGLWIPVTWQGWGVFVAYLVLMNRCLEYLKHPVLQVPYSKVMLVFCMLSLTFLFLNICYRKGQRYKEPNSHEHTH